MKRIVWVFTITALLCGVGTLAYYAFGRWMPMGDNPAAKPAPTKQRIRVAMVDLRNAQAASPILEDLKNAKPDMVMIWGYGRKDFDKLAVDMGLVRTVYSQDGCGVMSRWRLYRPKAKTGGLTTEHNIHGHIFKIQCGVSEALDDAMGFCAAEGDMASGFTTTVGIQTGIKLGISGGWVVVDKRDNPSGRVAWIELGWK